MITNLAGLLLILESLFLLIPVIVSLIYKESDLRYLLMSSGITFLPGLVLWTLTRKTKREIGKREAYLIVTLVWVVFSLFGALPLFLGGYVPNYTDAFFETISGFTTTGASILNNIEVLPHGILFWRSMTHFLGGMGILVLTIAILPFLGVGSVQLFQAGTTSLSQAKLHPRVRETARSLWGIYLLLVGTETILLWVGDMNLFDAICHSFGTIATGGFSTKNASMGAFSIYSQYVVLVFMILAGTNFTLHFYALHRNFDRVFKNKEYQLYFKILIVFGTGLMISLIWLQGLKPEQAFRDAFFQAASILTCTGFVNTDYMTWTHHLWFILFILMFIGGSSGSTSGGIKVARYLLFFENLRVQYRRILHPQAVVNVRVGGTTISRDVLSRTFVFFVLYFIIFFLGTTIMHFLGMSIPSSMGAVATTMGGIGPGFGSVGPASNFEMVPVLGKWVLSVLMLLGRLELFAVLILFSRLFWKDN